MSDGRGDALDPAAGMPAAPAAALLAHGGQGRPPQLTLDGRRIDAVVFDMDGSSRHSTHRVPFSFHGTGSLLAMAPRYHGRGPRQLCSRGRDSSGRQ